MKNRDLIENTRKKIISSFRALVKEWKDDLDSLESTVCITDWAAVTKYEFLSAALSFYPKVESLIDIEKEGIDLSVEFCQEVYRDKDGYLTFASHVEKLENGDWNLGKQIYISVDIYICNGEMIHEKELGLIKLREDLPLEKILSETVVEIFEYFRSKKELIFDSLKSLKKIT